MKKTAFFSTLTYFLFLCGLVFGQAEHKIIIGTVDSLYSHTLRESRKILIHLPSTSPDDFSPEQKYPVVYVLDGEVLFHSIVAITEQLGGGSGNFMFPKMIVIGITNTDRTRDFTPTFSTDSTIMPAFLLSNSGGGENFLSFFENELIPHIDSLCPAAPYRVLIGHSMGGLAAINALANHRNLFNAYVAIDPSLWWDNLHFLQQTEDILQKNTYRNTAMFMAIANNMEKSMTLQTVMNDTAARSLPMRSILEFDRFMKENTNHRLRYQSKYYSDYDHGNVPLVAEYDAMPFIFNFYGLNFPFTEFFEPDYTNDDIFINHYKMISRKMGYEVLPPGELINAAACQLMNTRQLNRAKRLFQLNIENYPDSYAPYEAMGDFYVYVGDKITAKTYYLKALTKKDMPHLNAKIEKLTTK